MRDDYKPIIKKVPMGYQGLVGIYQEGVYIDCYVSDDAVFDSEIIALHHAQREIRKYKAMDDLHEFNNQ